MEKLLETQRAAGHPDRISLVQADITLAQDRAKIASAVGTGTPLHVLVHNAGVVGPLKPFDTVQLDDFQHVMRTNVEAPIFLTQALLPNLITASADDQQQSRVLHVSSGCAHSASPSWLAYCVSKAAFLMAYKCLAVDLAPKRVLVGSFKPGIVDTEMQQEMRQATVEDFPKLDFFKRMREAQLEQAAETDTDKQKPHAPSRDRLDTADNVAHFAWFLLHHTTDDEFPLQDWDIRDEALYSRWIK